MFEREKKLLTHTDKKRILDELGDNQTANDILNFFLGDKDGCRINDIVCYEYKKSKSSFMQRLNLFWLAPIYIFTMPLQWLFLGHVGVRRNTKIGRLLSYLVNYD